MDLQSLLNKIRMSCPRLYFLSDEELIDMLCMTRDKRRWVPLVRQIFPGIHDLQFDLPPASKEETGMMQTSFDLQLHGKQASRTMRPVKNRLCCSIVYNDPIS